MMRNNSSQAAVVASQQALPEFIKLEQALVNKLEAVQRNLDNALDEISTNDSIQILNPARDATRRILHNAQIKLGKLAGKYASSNELLDFYRNVNQFICLADEMEMMFCQTLKNCMPKKEVSEEDEILLDSVDSDLDPPAEKTVEELFSELSAANCKDKFLADHSDMIAQIERMSELSNDIYVASRLVDSNSENPIFLVRFFDARRILSAAIEEIHYVIHPRAAQSNQSAGLTSRRRDRETAPSSEECCYEFGLISLCADIKKQMSQLLKKNNEAQAKRIGILKMICFIADRQPESVSCENASSSSSASISSSGSSSSSDASSSNSFFVSSSSSSSSSSSLFSRSNSPERQDQSQSSPGGSARPA